MASVPLNGVVHALPGPTGERNTYTLWPRGTVLCLAENEEDLLVQLAAVLAVGARALWPGASAALLQARLPRDVQAHIDSTNESNYLDAALDVVLHHGPSRALHAICQHMAQRPGAIIGVVGLAPGETHIALERLVIERSLSVNTAAAGGNASLMTMA